MLAARGPTYLSAVTVAHVLGIIAGGWVTVTLANSLFFELDAGASRIQVLRYLMITMLPVAVLARVLGPALDRVIRGPRWFGVCSNVLRAGCCIGLAATLGTLGFFVCAFTLLVGNKAFTAAKYALLPTLVPSNDLLVATNVRLAKWGAIAGALGVSIGVALDHMIGSRWLLVFAGGVFVLAAWTMTWVVVPSWTDRSRWTVSTTARAACRPARRATIAAVPFIATRCGVGVFSFTCAFTLRRAGAPGAVLGILGLCYAIGSLLGNVLAPMARRHTAEEQMIAFTVLAATASSAVAALRPSGVPIFIASFTLGFAAAHARQGFDSIVQSTCAAEQRGRVFAYFETRSQWAWVVGALSATFFALDLRPAAAILAGGFGVSLCVAREIFDVSAHAAQPEPVDPLPVEAVCVESGLAVVVPAVLVPAAVVRPRRHQLLVGRVRVRRQPSLVP